MGIAVGFITGIVKMIFKMICKAVMFTGLVWFLVPMISGLIFEAISGQNLGEALIANIIIDKFMWYSCFILCPLMFIQNVVRMVTKDQSFSILRTFKGLKEKKGFIAKTDGDTTALVSSDSLTGFVFGKQKGKYTVKPEQTDGHMLIVGGAGSGKTSAIAIPTLISWKKRAFVIDIKGELYEKTKHARIESNIKVFNPTDKKAYGYDPFYMLKITDDISAEARDLAISICPLSADVKDPFWIKSAQNMLTGFLLYFYQSEYSFSSAMKSMKSQPVRELVDFIMESGNDRAISEISQFSGMDDKTLSGVFTELSNHITVFATSDDLQNALNGEGNCITPSDLESGFDIYCCIPEHKLEQWKDLMGMMCNQFLKFFERRDENQAEPILFLIDEFARLGKIESISNGLATLRSKKIHIALIVQSKSQLNVNYGKDVAEVIADNCSYKAILKASEPTTQKWCSDLVGTYDKRKNSSNYNADIVGIGKGQGTSRTTEEKKIIKPEEFAYLQDVVCLFPNGYKRIEKIKYWEDSTFIS